RQRARRGVSGSSVGCGRHLLDPLARLHPKHERVGGGRFVRRLRHSLARDAAGARGRSHGGGGALAHPPLLRAFGETTRAHLSPDWRRRDEMRVILSCLSLAIFPGAAASGGAGKPQAAAIDAGVQAGPIAPTSPEVRSLIERMQRFYERTSDFTASFRQDYTYKSFNRTQ